MKHSFLTVLGLCFLLIFSTGLLGALEVEIIGGIDYFTYAHGLKEAYSSNIADPEDPEFDANKLIFNPYMFPFGNVMIKNEISENLALNIHLLRDKIIRNNIEFIFDIKSDFFSFKLGPFVGMPDVLEMPFFGILGSIELLYPGIVSVEAGGSATLSLNNLEFLSNHSRNTINAKIAVWLPSAIPSFTFSYKDFNYFIDNELYLLDTLIRYQLSFEFFAKRSPATFRLDAGYQELIRHFSGIYKDNPNFPSTPPDPEEPEFIFDDTVKPKDLIQSFFAGFELKVQLTQYICFVLGAEVPIYGLIWPKKPMTIPEFYLMPKATAGFVFSGK